MTNDEWLRTTIVRKRQTSTPPPPAPPPPPTKPPPRVPQGTRGIAGSPTVPEPVGIDDALRDFLDEHRGARWHRFNDEIGPRR